MVDHELEDEFVPNGHTSNVLCSVFLKGINNGVPLASIGSIIVLLKVDANKDRNVSFGHPDCLELFLENVKW